MVLLVLPYVHSSIAAATNRPRVQLGDRLVLLLITLFLSYTGYLLPWINWPSGPSVGTNIVSAMAGHRQQGPLRALGGNIVGENALLRFTCFTYHSPLLAFLLIGVHFWRVQKGGRLTVRSKDDDGKN